MQTISVAIMCFGITFIAFLEASLQLSLKLERIRKEKNTTKRKNKKIYNKY